MQVQEVGNSDAYEPQQQTVLYSMNADGSRSDSDENSDAEHPLQLTDPYSMNVVGTHVEQCPRSPIKTVATPTSILPFRCICSDLKEKRKARSIGCSPLSPRNDSDSELARQLWKFASIVPCPNVPDPRQNLKEADTHDGAIHLMVDLSPFKVPTHLSDRKAKPMTPHVACDPSATSLANTIRDIGQVATRSSSLTGAGEEMATEASQSEFLVLLNGEARLEGCSIGLFTQDVSLMDSILVWNARRIRNAPTIRTGRRLIVIHKPHVVAILEPIIREERRVAIGLRLGFHSSLSNGNEGGKFWIFYDSPSTVALHSISNQVLSITITLQFLQAPIMFLIVYAKCSRILRRSLWSNLISISNSIAGPWAVAGDFNALANSTERFERRRQPNTGDDEFAEAINDAGLLDVGFSDNRFTWSNNHDGNSQIWARLDRSLCNDEWIRCFPKFHVVHLPRVNSDHAPLLLNFPAPNKVLARPFRFQRMWFLHEGFLQIIKEAWTGDLQGSPMVNLLLKLRKTKLVVKAWNRSVFDNISTNRKQAELAFEQAEASAQSSSNSVPSEALLEAKDRLMQWELAEETFWKQKARNNWLAKGDKNTKFFHLAAMNRVRKAEIREIRSQVGSIITDPDKIKAQAVLFFSRLLSAETCQTSNMLENLIPHLLSNDDNLSLMHPPSLEEIYTELPLSCSMGVKFLEPLPLTRYASFPTRLATVLPKLISPEQGAFIQGRAIVENVALAWENFREINRKIHRGNIAIKFDMEKAYDRVNWDFLKLAQGYFKSSRGLRQGDPISPSLFILSSEVFSKGIKNLFNQGLCQPFKLKLGCPLISHLLYADDTLIFANGRSSSLSAINEFVSEYQNNSGQKINRSKSFFFYSSKLANRRVRSIEQKLHMSTASPGASYLGVPILSGKQSRAAFKPLFDKITAKIEGWKARILSQVGRATQIKHVLGSIPVHMRAATVVPSQTLGDMENYFANFFWGWANGKKKLHWTKWKKIAAPTSEGGLGIRRLGEMMDALRLKMA
ncbi:uncharacterized protein LOC131218159 [Magnolia sinica]|uniref:uncharacterized protein LOC131218159 n=1 Tax=Magnolia sinica TaxID=86752 RepID=UPI002658A93E|nr:uncharacterized protein LOC131218159 [Magnolia sinica]